MLLEKKINDHYTALNPTDLEIWQFIKNQLQTAAKMTIEELASCCNVSRTTIMRFAQKIGLEGYSELKVYLKIELESLQNTPLEPPFLLQAKKLIRFVETAATDELFQLIDQSQRFILYSSGNMQKMIAQEIGRIFTSAHKLPYQVEANHEAQLVLEVLNPYDMVWLVSLSGASKKSLAFAKALKIRGIPFVTLTQRGDNPLAQMAAFSFYVENEFTNPAGVAQSAFNRPSVVPYYFLIELLYLKYSQKGRPTYEN